MRHDQCKTHTANKDYEFWVLLVVCCKRVLCWLCFVSGAAVGYVAAGALGGGYGHGGPLGGVPGMGGGMLGGQFMDHSVDIFWGIHHLNIHVVVCWWGYHRLGGHALGKGEQYVTDIFWGVHNLNMVIACRVTNDGRGHAWVILWTIEWAFSGESII